MSDFAYEGVRRVVYGEERAQFVPVCVKCGRFVKAPETICLDGLIPPTNPTHTTCSRCGPTRMLFEGFV